MDRVGAVIRNRLLAALGEESREWLAPRLQPWHHVIREPVYGQGERIGSVVFPLSGVFSLVAELDGAAPVEIATVGNEGFVGLPVFLQATLTGVHTAFSQVEGDALRIDAADFLDVVNALPALRTILQRYAMALMTQIARGAACNRAHSAIERASRWLLQTHDRVGADRFVLPAEFLAQMLAEPPDEVLAALERQRLIEYANECVTVADRAGLERASCDCHRVIREEYERLLAPGAH
jgi:CRP-like cAMP-binding protein